MYGAGVVDLDRAAGMAEPQRSGVSPRFGLCDFMPACALFGEEDRCNVGVGIWLVIPAGASWCKALQLSVVVKSWSIIWGELDEGLELWRDGDSWEAASNRWVVASGQFVGRVGGGGYILGVESALHLGCELMDPAEYIVDLLVTTASFPPSLDNSGAVTENLVM